jgi:hypothetical protein
MTCFAHINAPSSTIVLVANFTPRVGMFVDCKCVVVVAVV